MSDDLDLGKMAKELMANLKEQQDVEKRLDKLKESINGGLTRLDNLLPKDGTTGDDLTDLVIRRCVPDIVLVNKYRELMNRLVGKTGQIILVITKEEYRSFGYGHNPDNCPMREVMRAGTLNGDKIVFLGGKYFFPVDAYLKYWENGLKQIESPMDLVYYQSNHNSFSERYAYPIILIGEAEINKWLKACSEKRILRVRKLLEIMENPSLFSRQQEEKRKKKPEPFISVTKGKT